MKRILLAIVLVLVIASMSSTPASAAGEKEVIKWRFQSSQTEKRIEFIEQVKWATAVDKATNGRLKITVYPSGSLGITDDAILRAVGKRLVDSAYSYGGYLTRDEPVLSILVPNACGVFMNKKEYIGVLPAAFEIAKKIYAKWNCHLLNMYGITGCYVGLSAKNPINTLERMKGLKLRGFPDPMQIEAFNNLGMAMQVFPQSDMYLNIKNKIVDGALTTPSQINALSLAEVLPYYAVITYYTAGQGHICNKDAFQALPKDIQDILTQVTEKMTEEWNVQSLDCSTDDKILANLTKEKGLKVLPEFSDTDKQALSVFAVKAWEKMAKQYGPEAAEYQKQMAAALSKFRGR